MFCYQCQETVKNNGCTIKGVCGKSSDVADLQDLLIYALKSLAIAIEKSELLVTKEQGSFISRALFTTITNANFNPLSIKSLIKEALAMRDKIGVINSDQNIAVHLDWQIENEADYFEKAKKVGVLSTKNEDVRSLRELLIYGLKGIAAYIDHAHILGYESEEVYSFLVEGLASTLKDFSIDKMVGLVLKAGSVAVTTMALLDKANTETFGNPQMSTVNIGVRTNPGILVSGHDLLDLKELLEQTKGSGVDVYTHGEMLPANYYPELKKYENFVGNYGNSWWMQDKEFESFNGPILMTTNCITPVKDSYKDRIFTTGASGYPDVKHIADRSDGDSKDFSQIIELAKKCPSPTEIETGEIVGGFAHAQVLALADKVVEAVKSGAIKKFIVMAGCDGRQRVREYFTDVAKALPKDTIILTAGCAKYRYNKLDLGDISGIPRVLDAGQCNDSYSLAVIALKLKEVFGLKDINQLPIEYDIAWYEQKAVTVLLALLSLGVKGIHLGPTLPAFVSPNVLKVLVERFDIKPISTVEADVRTMVGV